ncbi:EAL domain-containing protein [Achromobacter arsenitoxydans]|uniref:EAL domain-containing protein 5 n=1 Tax=Achromobacter arsenitoxydans SY8 TaxID=477184 RepID=H0FDD0_9BURK|nr:EAL domain-containing protein [Achromobacter arsenitoxydans]EHK63643.1 EAL domain-containing protein 5 [Achromobacter arsenitoxydans SY8]
MPKSVFLRYPKDRLAALASANALRAIREGLLWTLPCLLVSALFLLLSVCARLLGLPDVIADLLAGAHRKLSAIMPLLAGMSIGYMLSIRHRLPHLPTALLCLSYVVIAESLLAPYPRATSTLMLFIAILSPLATVPLMAWLHRRRWTQLAPDGLIGENVRDSLNMIVPGLLTAGLLMALLATALRIPAVAQFDIPLSVASLDNPFASGALIAALNSLLWFFGIHGAHAMAPIMEVLDQATQLNATTAAAGYESVYALNGTLLGAFAFIGGSGATLSLVVAILLFSRSESLRLLALASIPVSLLNVNEILLFGLPLILNPRLLLPFVLAPVANVLIAVAVVQLGWLQPATVALPLTSPVLFNAYIGAGEHLGGIVLQLLLLGLGVCLYAPCVIALERQRKADATVYFKSLDTTFPQLQEESLLYAHDPLATTYANRARRRAEVSRIRAISEYDFYLEFQPQVSLRTGLCTGCEALLRATGPEGTQQAPLEFLRWLAQADLMREVDLWVARQAVRQCLAWRAQGFTLPMTINVTSGTLTTPAFLDKLIEVLEQAQGQVSVELTEDALVEDAQALHTAFSRLHGIGARVYIDDFGTGYSALSYLHQFQIDAVKIDRSFVLAQSHDRGALVMSGLLRFCEALNLQIIVEGVETDVQLSALESSAEIIVQGWYYSKAVPGEHVVDFARRRQQMPAAPMQSEGAAAT